MTGETREKCVNTRSDIQLVSPWSHEMPLVYYFSSTIFWFNLSVVILKYQKLNEKAHFLDFSTCCPEFRSPKSAQTPNFPKGLANQNFCDETSLY